MWLKMLRLMKRARGYKTGNEQRDLSSTLMMHSSLRGESTFYTLFTISFSSTPVTETCYHCNHGGWNQVPNSHFVNRMLLNISDLEAEAKRRLGELGESHTMKKLAEVRATPRLRSIYKFLIN